MYVGPTGHYGKRYKFPGIPTAKPRRAPAPMSGNTTPVPAPAGNPGLGQGLTAPAPAAPDGGTPGTPPSAPVPPYMKGPDIINYGDAYKSREDQLAQSDKDLGDIKAWAQTALYNIGQNYIHGVDNTQNAAAARGIFQSSIKDGSLADLAATKATLSSDVNTKLNNAQVFHDSAIQRISDWWNNFQEGMNSIMAQNASDAGPGDPGSPGTPATPPAAPKAAPAKPKYGYVGPLTKYVKRNGMGRAIKIAGY